MEKIREKVINFMEHNEILTKLKDEQWYSMEDNLVKFVKQCILSQQDVNYNVTLASGEKLNIQQTQDFLYVKDDFNQIIEFFDLIVNTEGVIEYLQKIELLDYADNVFRSYDWSDDLKQIVDTYIEDITIGNGEEAVEQEVKQIRHDFEQMSEKDFCIAWGIYKIGNTYFKP